MAARVWLTDPSGVTKVTPVVGTPTTDILRVTLLDSGVITRELWHPKNVALDAAKVASAGTLDPAAPPAHRPLRGKAPSAVQATVTGTPTVGQVLTATALNVGGTVTYQWKRDGVNIAGATAATYTLVAADQNHQISCAVAGTAVAPPAANSQAVSVS